MRVEVILTTIVGILLIIAFYLIGRELVKK